MHLAALAQQHPAAGIAGNARLVHVDALRGFALIGILTVNIWAFADPYFATGTINPFYDSMPGRIARYLLEVVFEMKFYLLFSFLFGYSFTLQMASAQQAGASFMARMLRRQAALLAIGVLHYVLLFEGDILVTYALLGLILLACRNLKPSIAITAGASLLFLNALFWITLGLFELFFPSQSSSAAAAAAADVQAKLAALSGDAFGAVSYRLTHMTNTVAAIWGLQGPSALAMFFFGYSAGQRGLFAHRRPQQYLSRPVVWLALLLGLSGSLAYAVTGDIHDTGSAWYILSFGVMQLTAPLLSMSYMLAILALLRSDGGERLRTALATVGKISLTNYLLQSIVLCLIFTGYGFTLINRLHPFVLLPLVPAIFCTQIALSRWWLRTHPYGPAEWVLRALTTAKLPAWRRP